MNFDFSKVKSIEITEKGLFVSDIVEKINECRISEENKKLSATRITDWLLENDYFVEGEFNGKNKRIITEKGIQLGLSQKEKKSMYGTILVTYYDANAQKFIYDNLDKFIY